MVFISGPQALMNATIMSAPSRVANVFILTHLLMIPVNAQFFLALRTAKTSTNILPNCAIVTNRSAERKLGPGLLPAVLSATCLHRLGRPAGPRPVDTKNSV
jgi:hypothetical protein